MAQTVLELLAAIKAEVDELYKFFDERDKLVEQIEEIVIGVQETALHDSDWELMEKGTTITQKITHILNTSVEDRDELQKIVVALFSKSADGIDETDENVERLEGILARARFSNVLATTLRTTLTGILEEAKALTKSHH
jgi:hypothetical protein